MMEYLYLVNSPTYSTNAIDDNEKPPRFTFQELVDMIENGIEIPGKYYIA